jgi:hypothetical protein
MVVEIGDEWALSAVQQMVISRSRSMDVVDSIPALQSISCVILQRL